MQSLWAFYLGILAETPNPFPVVKGCVCFVGSASCRAFGHTRPASMPGLSVGLPPSPCLGLRPKPCIIKNIVFLTNCNTAIPDGIAVFLHLYSLFEHHKHNIGYPVEHGRYDAYLLISVLFVHCSCYCVSLVGVNSQLVTAVL